MKIIKSIIYFEKIIKYIIYSKKEISLINSITEVQTKKRNIGINTYTNIN